MFNQVQPYPDTDQIDGRIKGNGPTRRGKKQFQEEMFGCSSIDAEYDMCICYDQFYI